GELAAEVLDRHPARRRPALVAAHAIGDRHHPGLGVDQVAILVALALAPRIALAPRPQPHDAHRANICPITNNSAHRITRTLHYARCYCHPRSATACPCPPPWSAG